MTQRSAWIGAITIDCDDADVMRRFYAEALDGVDIPGFPQSVRVGGMPLNFRELEDWVRPTWPGGDMQMHFEILVNEGELKTQEARLISLGATKSPHMLEARLASKLTRLWTAGLCPIFAVIVFLADPSSTATSAALYTVK